MKLETTPADLNKLSNVVKKWFRQKTEYNAKIKNIEEQIPDIINLATKTILNTKTNKFKRKVLSVTNLYTTTALTAAENKILNASNLVKKLTIT